MCDCASVVHIELHDGNVVKQCDVCSELQVLDQVLLAPVSATHQWHRVASKVASLSHESFYE